MALTTLWLTDFRCFDEARVEFDPTGLTVLRGENGAGKTSVLEAFGWLATGMSFRGASREALIRTGSAQAVVRAEGTAGERPVLIESVIPATGPARTQVNRQPARRRAELAEALRVSVFSPDDLELVQGGPSARRDYLDEALAGRHPRNEQLLSDVDRILRQRGSLLRQAGSRGTGRGPAATEISDTLGVWDDRLAAAGQALVDERRALLGALEPLVGAAYRSLADRDEVVRTEYRCSWQGPLAAALVGSRAEDLRRQATTVGPHRDDLALWIDDRPARTHASQGEQRTLSLALRLATHQLATAESGHPPVLLLDDVFSELDARRAAALVEQMPRGQVLLTTAVDPPPVVSVDRVIAVAAGRVLS
ncbi:MAG: DNA replication/repair protein RecF [Acidimicrobiales bacterium]